MWHHNVRGAVRCILTQPRAAAVESIEEGEPFEFRRSRWIMLLYVTPLVLRACLASRFRPKQNFRNEFLGFFDLKRT